MISIAPNADVYMMRKMGLLKKVLFPDTCIDVLLTAKAEGSTSKKGIKALGAKRDKAWRAKSPQKIMNPEASASGHMNCEDL